MFQRFFSFAWRSNPAPYGDGRLDDDATVGGSKKKSDSKSKGANVWTGSNANGYLLKKEYLVDKDISNGREFHRIPAVSYLPSDVPPRDYHYVTSYVHNEPIRINTSIDSMYYCQCTGSCANGECSCTSSHHRGICYDYKGRLNRHYDFSFPEVIYECNSNCQCNRKKCRNVVIQSGSKARFVLYRTKSKGWGVRTLEDLQRGTFVGVYSGELISAKDSTRRNDDTYLFNLSNSNTMNIHETEESLTTSIDSIDPTEQEDISERKSSNRGERKSYVCDAKRYGNFTRFINHSCEPNVVGIRSYTTHQDSRFPYIAFFTKDFVPANSELTLNYGDNYWIIKCKRDGIYCLCRTQSCRFSKKSFAETSK